MSIGLLGLLDDVAALAKVAAASLDDVIGQAAKAGTKAAGVVIDDAAVTPRYVVGFASSRELPIVGRIAIGSMRNKLLILLPAALAMSSFAPWLIMPMLMLGGLYLCYEGAEKVLEAVAPHHAKAHESAMPSVAIGAKTLEEQRIASAIKTDFILSAEIMAITLASIETGSIVGRAAVLAVVAVGITIAVYGAVALIVKMDDIGVALARSGPAVSRAVGRGLVIGMPYLLKTLSIVGTAAMVWVGGGIIVHGLESYGFTALGHLIHDAAAAAARGVPAVSGLVEWAVSAAGAGVIGLVAGGLLIPIAEYGLGPMWKGIKRLVKPGAI